MNVPHKVGGTERGRSREQLRYSTPVVVSIVAVVVVVVLAGVLLFSPRGLFGIALAPTSEAPSASMPSATTVVTPTPDPTPSRAALPTPSVAPIAEPTPAVVRWTGLVWSEPILRQEAPYLEVNDSMWWQDGYVGVGEVVLFEASSPEQANRIPVFLRSADGVTWSRVQEFGAYAPLLVDGTFGPQGPVEILATNDVLLAWSGWRSGGYSRFWTSEDGLRWTEVAHPMLAADGFLHGHPTALAADRSVFVLVGAEGSGCCMNPEGDAVVLVSSDGASWRRAPETGVPAQAYLADVAAFPGGFVAVGREGRTDQPDFVSTDAGAWFSIDGFEWFRGEVEGGSAGGNRLDRILTAAQGLAALGIGSDHIWTSDDGRTWSTGPTLGRDVPLIESEEPWAYAPLWDSDGVRMLATGAASDTAFGAWISVDGTAWSRLEFSGAAPPVMGADDRYRVASIRLQPDAAVLLGWLSADDDADPRAASWVATPVIEE